MLRSLYEEEITGEQMDAFFHSESHGDSFAEAASYAPDPEAALGPDEYLEHLRRVKAAVRIPVVASLNGTTPGGWIVLRPPPGGGRRRRPGAEPLPRGQRPDGERRPRSSGR